MNKKQRKILDEIFRNPISGNIEWSKIEYFLKSIGCQVIESGKGVTFEKDGIKEFFHRPHPQKEALRYRVKAVRNYLIKLGVKP